MMRVVENIAIAFDVRKRGDWEIYHVVWWLREGRDEPFRGRPVRRLNKKFWFIPLLE